MKNTNANIAEKIVLRLIEDFSITPTKRYDEGELSKINIHLLGGLSFIEGDIISFQPGSDVLEYVVVETIPEGTVVLDENTQIQIIKSDIKNIEVSFEHENKVLGKFRQAEKAFLEIIGGGVRTANASQKVIGTYSTSDYDIDYIEAYKPLADLFNEMKKFEDDVVNLRRIVRKDPNDVLARYDLALRLRALRQYFDAEEEFIRALTLSPDSAALHASYGNMLALKKFEYSHSFALQEYFKAIELAPENIEYRHMLVALYKIEESYDKAPEALQDIIKIKPDDVRAYKLLGDLFLDKYKDYVEALNCYKKCLELEPDDPEIHHSIGRTYCRLRRFKDAKEEFEKYILHFPDSMNAEEIVFWERSLTKDECNESCHSCGI